MPDPPRRPIVGALMVPPPAPPAAGPAPAPARAAPGGWEWTTFASLAEEEEANRRAAWALTPRERLAELERLRMLNYPGYDPAASRMPRVLESVAPGGG